MKQYRFEICTLDGEILDRGRYRAESEDDLGSTKLPQDDRSGDRFCGRSQKKTIF